MKNIRTIWQAAFSSECLVELLLGNAEIDKDQIPKDGKKIRFAYDARSDCIILRMESQTKGTEYEEGEIIESTPLSMKWTP